MTASNRTRQTIFAALLIGAALIVTGVALGNTGVKGDAPAMMVSPQTIVLDKIDTVTVHTNIPFSSVAEETLLLEEAAPIGVVWADDCGHIAARFAVSDLGLSPADEVVLTLSGCYDGGVAFEATDIVRVK